MPHFHPVAEIHSSRTMAADLVELGGDELVFERQRIRLRYVYSLRFEKWLELQSKEELYDFGEERLSWGYEGEYPETASEQRRVIKNQLMLDLEQVVLKSNREVAYVTLEGVEWLMSGGMSSGDAPTDAMHPLDRLDASGALNDAITTNEYTAGSTYERGIRTKEQS